MLKQVLFSLFLIKNLNYGDALLINKFHYVRIAFYLFKNNT